MKIKVTLSPEDADTLRRMHEAGELDDIGVIGMSMQERRLRVDPMTTGRDYTKDEAEFLEAMTLYKRANKKPFPTYEEILGVIRFLGYRNQDESSTESSTAFIKAMERYEKRHRRPFPTYAEILDVALSLGYSKPSKETDEP